jgi:hypothetical protein
MPEPVVKRVIEETGEISDEMDYALANYLTQNEYFGYTPCQPSLVELKNGKNAIKIGLDHTFIGEDNQLMGYGIVGYIYVDADSTEIIFCPPVADLEANVETLVDSGIDPQPRPRGKY